MEEILQLDALSYINPWYKEVRLFVFVTCEIVGLILGAFSGVTLIKKSEYLIEKF